MTAETMLTEAMIEAGLSAARRVGLKDAPVTIIFLAMDAARPSQPDAAMVEQQIAAYLDTLAETAVNSNSDFNQGVVRGLEIAAAQFRYGHARNYVAALRTEGGAPGDDLRETLRSMADELDGLIPYLASHHHDVTKLTGLIGKARGFEGRSRD
jgi:hypothetical protein